TDLSRNDTILSSFLSKFPCVLILSDFNEILHPLLELYNSRDGTLLFKFLEPLVNSLIVSSGMELFSIGDDTYAAYAKQLHKDTKNV
ncbi:9912_t:CDS:1, partial [Funneliformis caledonium]